METWKIHPVHTDYEVSDQGRVRRATPSMGTRVGKILRPALQLQGYRIVGIGDRTPKVSVLVLEAFVGVRPEGHEARHLNGIKDDDRLANLAWGTHSENYQDRVRHGGGNHGSRHGLAKLEEFDIRSIRARYVPKIVTQKMLAAEFGVTRECVKLIVGGKRWKHV